MQPISSSLPTLPPVAGPREAQGIPPTEDAAQARPRTPVTDRYIPEAPPEPSGQYRPGRDENGDPRIFFDDPERREDGKTSERCTCSTDRVDREIESLKQRQEELARRLQAETDDGRIRELERQLSQTDRELRQKDNDAYRRQHAEFSE